MFSGFALSLIWFLTLVVFPGYCLFRTFGAGRLVSVACAPTLTILLLVLLGILYSALGVSSTPLIMFGPAALICLLPAVLNYVRRGVKVSSVGSVLAYLRRSAAPQFALCVILSLGIMYYFFLFRGVQNPDDFIQIYDNTYHLSVAKSMAESGDFSVLSTSAYLETSAELYDPNPTRGFYPAAWHILVALLCQSLSLSVTTAMNYVNAIFIGFVFPVGSLSLVAEISGFNRRVLFSAAFAPLLFVAFPWTFLYWGPLYPNLSAFSLVPALLAFFISQTQHASGLKRNRVPRLMLFVLGMLALVFLQPNSVFTLGVWAVPYCVWRLATTRFISVERISGLKPSSVRLLAVSGFGSFVVIAWIFFYSSSFMRGVVSYSDWTSFGGITDAVWHIASLTLMGSAPQYLLAAVVLLGVLYTFVNRRYLWLTVSLLIFSLMFTADVISDGTVRHVLTGFWYTDPYRIAAMVTMSCVPLAALGLSLLPRLVNVICVGKSSDERPNFFSNIAVAFLTAVVACTSILWPYSNGSEVDESLAFGKALSAIRWMYSLDDTNNNLTRQEAEFVSEVSELVPEDAVILNQPYDGSVFAYASDDLNLYYRKFGEAAADGETSESELLRTAIDECSENNEVQEAIDKTGVEYLLILDQGNKMGEGRSMPGYDEDDWVGIDSVRDDTPGFEVVLSEGDMRLYRIVA